MARSLFNPETALDNAWVYVVSHDGKSLALFPYIDALTPVPTLASICHQIDGTETTKEDRRELAALVRQRGANAGWLFDGVFAWLVTPMERDNVARRQITIHTAAPRRKAPLVRRPGRTARKRQPPKSASKSKIKSSRK
jgi:hypothetical protein